MARKARDPPSHTGLVIHHSIVEMAAARRPKASLTQKYGPPSIAKALPSSAVMKA